MVSVCGEVGGGGGGVISEDSILSTSLIENKNDKFNFHRHRLLLFSRRRKAISFKLFAVVC